MAVVLAGTITSIVNRSPVRYVPETPRPPCSARSCARLARRRITDTLRDMSDRIGLLGTARNLLLLLWGVLGYVLRSLWLLVLPRAALVTRLMALEAQLASCLDADHYHVERPRQWLDGEVPIPHDKLDPDGRPHETRAGASR